LRMDDTVVVINVAADAATNLPPVEALEPLGPPQPETIAFTETAPSTNAAAAPPAQPPVTVEGTPMITPQMLADFFQQLAAGTNAPVAAPSAGPFVPPLPPSSSATYRSR